MPSGMHEEYVGKELEAEEERCLPPRLLWEVAESDGMDATNRDTNPISNAITHTTLSHAGAHRCSIASY